MDPNLEEAALAIAHRYPVSPSQLTQYVQCPRTWAIRYLDGFKTTTRFLEIGKRGHEYLESWLRDGLPPPTKLHDGSDDWPGIFAQTAIPHLPKPGTPGMTVEGNGGLFRFEHEGIYYRGVMDVMLEDGDHVEIQDHKFYSPRTPRKTSEQLASDPQGAIYGAYGYLECGAELVTGQWNYVIKDKRNPRTIPVRTTFSYEGVMASMSELRRVAIELLATRVLYETSHAVPRNMDHCSKEGGFGHKCWNLPACHLHSRERNFQEQIIHLRTS